MAANPNDADNTREELIGNPHHFKLIRAKYQSEVAAKTAPQAQPIAELVTPQPPPSALRKALNSIGAFLTFKFFLWLKHMVAHFGGTKHDFLNYPAGDSGVYPAQSKNGGAKTNNITIALTADWATDTPESIKVVQDMMTLNPDYTIHLGDTYYAGQLNEINDNYMGDGAPWQRAPSGSFSLMGNHEMYSCGGPYYDPLLKSLGIKDFTKNEYTGQQASYFCLQTDFWNIIGLDTGYNSVGFPFFKGKSDCHFEQGMIDWLGTLNLAGDNRGIILLSHHQYSSAYEEEYYTPAEQLKPFIGAKSVVWIWGHEHRFAVYGKWSSANGITAYGRCIGNGGMPVELNGLYGTYSKENKEGFGARATDRRLVICDKRLDEPVGNIIKINIGFNGFTSITLQDEKATISYYSSSPKVTQPTLLLQEYWMMHEGDLTGYVSQYMDEPGFTTYNQQPIMNAVS